MAKSESDQTVRPGSGDTKQEKDAAEKAARPELKPGGATEAEQLIDDINLDNQAGHPSTGENEGEARGENKGFC